MATGLPVSLQHHKMFQKPLQFSRDGTFRILHLTDIHEIVPEMDTERDLAVAAARSTETVHVIRTCVEWAKPDLVVFGGDNITGYRKNFTYDRMYQTIQKIIAPVVEKNIPLAIVFGNHDAEVDHLIPALQRENQIAVYAEYENFRGTMNEEEVYGCGNYSLPILSSDGTRKAWNLWFIDSNDYIRDENHALQKDLSYDCVHPDQIAWYERKAAALRAENGGKPLPSLLFQHIPVLQEYDKLIEIDGPCEGALTRNGRYYRVPEDALTDGYIHEAPCPPYEDRQQFESWKKTGDIVAAFFGHDHVNAFTMEIDGIRLVQTHGAGYHNYGERRGGRLIVLRESIPDRYETELLYVDRITELPI